MVCDGLQEGVLWGEEALHHRHLALDWEKAVYSQATVSISWLPKEDQERKTTAPLPCAVTPRYSGKVPVVSDLRCREETTYLRPTENLQQESLEVLLQWSTASPSVLRSQLLQLRIPVLSALLQYHSEASASLQSVWLPSPWLVPHQSPLPLSLSLSLSLSHSLPPSLCLW